MTYASYDDYLALGLPALEGAEGWLHRASGDVDTLTFNRIVERGFAQLTEFQREIITEVVCGLAQWESANADLLDSPLSGYTINGVSAQFGETAGVAVQDGVAIPRRLYQLLEQTGLCYRRL